MNIKQLFLTTLIASMGVTAWANIDISKKYFLKLDNYSLYLALPPTTSGSPTVNTIGWALKFASTGESGKYYITNEEGTLYLGYTGTSDDGYTLGMVSEQSKAAKVTPTETSGVYTLEGNGENAASTNCNGNIGLNQNNTITSGSTVYGDGSTGKTNHCYNWTLVEADQELNSGWYYMQCMLKYNDTYNYYGYYYGSVDNNNNMILEASTKLPVYVVNSSGVTFQSVDENTLSRVSTANNDAWTVRLNNATAQTWTVETGYDGTDYYYAFKSDVTIQGPSTITGYLGYNTSTKIIADLQSRYPWKLTDFFKANNGDATVLIQNADCTVATGWTNGNTSSNQKGIDGTGRTLFEITSNVSVSQTISNLPAGTYTVQVPVRGCSGGSATLKLNNTEKGSVTFYGGDNKGSDITADGLVVPTKVDGHGWNLLEGDVTITEGQSITIAVAFSVTSYSGNWGQMCDVKLLKDANTVGNYWTNASDTYVDLTALNHHFFKVKKNQLVVNTTNSSSARNVIVGSTCANLELTDGDYNFGNTGSEFTATSVSYDRTFTADNTSTVCLPFALTKEEAAALGKFYTLSSYSANTLHFEESTTGVEAYKPYLFVPTATSFSEYSSKTIAANPGSLATTVSENAASFIGTMTAQSLQSESDGSNTLYGYQNGQFVKIGTGSGAHINPFRAYISIPVSSPGAPAMLNIDFGGNTTGINTVNGEGLKVNGYYNLNGQRVSQPSKGLYIMNGKKVIIK